MPYKVQAKKSGKSVSVVLSSGSQEKSVILRWGDVAYSAVLTADMRSQQKLGYIVCSRIDNADHAFAEVILPVDSAKAAPSPKPPKDDSKKESKKEEPKEEECYSEDELRAMKKPELLVIAEELGIEDLKVTKDELLEELLAYDIPKE